MNIHQMPVNQMNIRSEMVAAFEAGCDNYQPVCEGVTLEMENGDPAVTTRNLHRVINSHPERAILAIIGRGKTNPVLIVLKTGETFLATGFTPAGVELARFLVEHNDGDWSGDADEVHRELTDWPLEGLIPLTPP